MLRCGVPPPIVVATPLDACLPTGPASTQGGQRFFLFVLRAGLSSPPAVQHYHYVRPTDGPFAAKTPVLTVYFRPVKATLDLTCYSFCAGSSLTAPLDGVSRQGGDNSAVKTGVSLTAVPSRRGERDCRNVNPFFFFFSFLMCVGVGVGLLGERDLANVELC